MIFEEEKKRQKYSDFDKDSYTKDIKSFAEFERHLSTFRADILEQKLNISDTEIDKFIWVCKLVIVLKTNL